MADNDSACLSSDKWLQFLGFYLVAEHNVYSVKWCYPVDFIPMRVHNLNTFKIVACLSIEIGHFLLRIGIVVFCPLRFRFPKPSP